MSLNLLTACDPGVPFAPAGPPDTTRRFGVHLPCGIQSIGSWEGVTSMVFQGGFNALDFFLGYNFTRTLIVGNFSSAADTGIDRVASTASRTAASDRSPSDEARSYSSHASGLHRGIRARGYASDPILHRPIAAGGYRDRLERSCRRWLYKDS